MKHSIAIPAADVNVGNVLGTIKEMKVWPLGMLSLAVYIHLRFIVQASVADLSADYRQLERTRQFLKRIVHKRNPFEHPTEEEQVTNGGKACCPLPSTLIVRFISSRKCPEFVRGVAEGSTAQRPAP